MQRTSISHKIGSCVFNPVGRNSSVGIATRYWLDGSEIESVWVEIFRTRLYRPWAYLVAHTMHTGSLSRG